MTGIREAFPTADTACERFRGTKPAQTELDEIEIACEFLLSAEPHNLKVIGSNPIPATNFVSKINKIGRRKAAYLLSKHLVRS